jgi:hypothetical protein
MEERTACVNTPNLLVQVDAEVLHPLHEWEIDVTLPEGAFSLFYNELPNPNRIWFPFSILFKDTSGIFPGVKWPGRETVRAPSYGSMSSRLDTETNYIIFNFCVLQFRGQARELSRLSKPLKLNTVLLTEKNINQNFTSGYLKVIYYLVFRIIATIVIIIIIIVFVIIIIIIIIIIIYLAGL